jgi:hypothetical protein
MNFMSQENDRNRMCDRFDPANTDHGRSVGTAIPTDRFRATPARAGSPTAGPIAAHGPRQQVRLENLECI